MTPIRLNRHMTYNERRNRLYFENSLGGVSLIDATSSDKLTREGRALKEVVFDFLRCGFSHWVSAYDIEEVVSVVEEAMWDAVHEQEEEFKAKYERKNTPPKLHPKPPKNNFNENGVRVKPTLLMDMAELDMEENE